MCVCMYVFGGLGLIRGGSCAMGCCWLVSSDGSSVVSLHSETKRTDAISAPMRATCATSSRLCALKLVMYISYYLHKGTPATDSVCGLKLRVHPAFSWYCVRPCYLHTNTPAPDTIREQASAQTHALARTQRLIDFSPFSSMILHRLKTHLMRIKIAN